MIEIKVKHILNSNYFNTIDCPFARAVKEQLNQKVISVGFAHIKLENDQYIFTESYSLKEFNEDQMKLRISTNPEEIIRTIKILSNE